jgi:hypothetical protein
VVEVTGVARSTTVDLVRSRGVAGAADYTFDDFGRTGVRYDVIIDVAGNRRVPDLCRALTPKGWLVIEGREGGDRVTGGMHGRLRALLLTAFVGQTLTALISKERGEDAWSWPVSPMPDGCAAIERRRSTESTGCLKW